jgi:hypothetical protein
MLVGLRLEGGGILPLIDHPEVGASLRSSLASLVRLPPSAVSVTSVVEHPSGLAFEVTATDPMNVLAHSVRRRRAEVEGDQDRDDDVPAVDSDGSEGEDGEDGEDGEGEGENGGAVLSLPTSPRASTPPSSFSRQLQGAGPASSSPAFLFLSVAIDLSHPSAAQTYPGVSPASLAVSTSSLIKAVFSNAGQVVAKLGPFLSLWASATGQSGVALDSLVALRTVRLPLPPSSSPLPPSVPLTSSAGFLAGVGFVGAVAVVLVVVLSVGRLRYPLLYRLHLSVGWEAQPRDVLAKGKGPRPDPGEEGEEGEEVHSEETFTQSNPLRVGRHR